MAYGGWISSSLTKSYLYPMLPGRLFQPDRSVSPNLRCPYRPRFPPQPLLLLVLPLSRLLLHPSLLLLPLGLRVFQPRFAALTISLVRETICFASLSGMAPVTRKLRASTKFRIQGSFIQGSNCASHSREMDVSDVLHEFNQIVIRGRQYTEITNVSARSSAGHQADLAR
jgi:hypothetical protein